MNTTPVKPAIFKKQIVIDLTFDSDVSQTAADRIAEDVAEAVCEKVEIEELMTRHLATGQGVTWEATVTE